MTSTEAAQILQLPPSAPPAQVEARFRELRAVLEDKIAKALTPGLQEKYRVALAEITTAYETLVLAADIVALPGLSANRPVTPSSVSRLPPIPSLPPLPAHPPKPTLPPLPSPAPPAAHTASAVLPAPPIPQAPPIPATSPKSSGGKGLLIGVAAAVVVLAGGGWLVLKIRAENAEKARIEAEARHQAELARQQAEAQEKARIAAAAKAERDQLDRQLAALRSRVTEINASFDSAIRAQQSLEKEIAELLSQKTELESTGKAVTSPEMRSLTAKLQSRESYRARLIEILSTHPAKAARLQAAEALATRAIDTANTAIENYGKAVRQLQFEIGKARDELLVITGRLRITSEPVGLDFTITDAYGRTSQGRAPADLSDVPLGSVTVAFLRAGWPQQTRSGEVTRAATASISGDLTGGALRLTSTPLPADFVIAGQGRNDQGRTPATLPELPVGNYQITYTLAGWPSQTGTATITRGSIADHEARFAAPGTLRLDSKPAGASVTFKGQAVGTTPLVLPDLPPGPVSVELALTDYRPASLQGAIVSGKETALSATLRPAALSPEEAFEKFAKDANGTWVCHGRNGLGGNADFYLRFVAGSRTLSFQQTGFGGSTRNMTMVDYDAATRTVLIMFGGLDALNGKLGIRFEGDTIVFGKPNRSFTLIFHRGPYGE